MAIDRSPSDAEDRIFPLSVAQYHAMRDAGILDEDDKVELLDGQLVAKMTKNPPHTTATVLVQAALQRVLPSGYHVRAQEPVTTTDSEPEPDVLVARGDVRDYVQRHPGPDDVPLVVEVSDVSLRLDRGRKLAVYARAGIAWYWIVNLRDRVVEAYRDPDGVGYAAREEYGPGTQIPLVIEGSERARIPVDSILP